MLERPPYNSFADGLLNGLMRCDLAHQDPERWRDFVSEIDPEALGPHLETLHNLAVRLPVDYDFDPMTAGDFLDALDALAKPPRQGVSRDQVVDVALQRMRESGTNLTEEVEAHLRREAGPIWDGLLYFYSLQPRQMTLFDTVDQDSEEEAEDETAPSGPPEEVLSAFQEAGRDFLLVILRRNDLSPAELYALGRGLQCVERFPDVPANVELDFTVKVTEPNNHGEHMRFRCLRITTRFGLEFEYGGYVDGPYGGDSYSDRVGIEPEGYYDVDEFGNLPAWTGDALRFASSGSVEISDGYPPSSLAPVDEAAPDPDTEPADNDAEEELDDGAQTIGWVASQFLEQVLASPKLQPGHRSAVQAALNAVLSYKDNAPGIDVVVGVSTEGGDSAFFEHNSWRVRINSEAVRLYCEGYVRTEAGLDSTGNFFGEMYPDGTSDGAYAASDWQAPAEELLLGAGDLLVEDHSE